MLKKARMRLRSCRDYTRVLIDTRRIRNGFLILVFCIIIFTCQVNYLQQKEVTNTIIESGIHYLFAVNDNATTETNLSKLETIILDKNTEEKVLNERTYGPITEDTIVIVIIVDKYSVNLKFMLYSLSQVKGIQDVLLIFSHSNYDENANILIKTIEFCRVLQIYYPHSVQLHPNKFPGFSSNDCPPDITLAAAVAIDCAGAYSYDIHGHYRNPHSSEKKHHWWWTANQVFESLTTMENHIGIVVFVHDDYFFLEDFLYMTGYMKNISGTMPACEFLSLAGLPEIYETGSVQRAVKVTSWDPALHSGVLAFDRDVWNSIVWDYDLFCQVDDYSWSQSLSYLSFNRKDGDRYKVMTSVFPRAYKPSQCLYFCLLGCGIYSSVHQIMSLQNSNYHELFPTNIEVFVDIDMGDGMDFDFMSSNGRWNDPRDKELCANLTLNKIQRVVYVSAV